MFVLGLETTWQRYKFFFFFSMREQIRKKAHKKEHITNLQREYWEVSDVFIYYQLNQLSPRLIPPPHHPHYPSKHPLWVGRAVLCSLKWCIWIALKKRREKHGNGSHDGDTFNLQLQSFAQSQVTDTRIFFFLALCFRSRELFCRKHQWNVSEFLWARTFYTTH